MRPAILNPLFAAVTSLPGVGPKQDKLLRYLLGRSDTPRLADLLLHLPSGVIDRRSRPTIAEAVPGTVVGREYFGHDQLVTVALADGTRLRHRGGGDAMWRRGDDVRLWISGPATVVAAEPAATPDPSGAPAGSTSMRVSA